MIVFHDLHHVALKYQWVALNLEDIPMPSDYYIIRCNKTPFFSLQNGHISHKVIEGWFSGKETNYVVYIIAIRGSIYNSHTLTLNNTDTKESGVYHIQKRWYLHGKCSLIQVGLLGVTVTLKYWCYITQSV